MANNSVAKIQHYVPQFILKNWGIGKKKQINVFDKHTENVFTTKIKNVASESRFYDFEFEGQKYTIEPALGKIETRAKNILDKIIEHKTLKALSDDEFVSLCVFLSIQNIRTKHAKEMFVDFANQFTSVISERFKNTKVNTKEINDSFGDLDENTLKLIMVQNIIKAPEHYAEHFLNKVAMVGITDSKHPLIIGDHPVTLQNSLDLTPYGNIGLAVTGIEIYFPISPNIVIIFWCPSHYDNLKNTLSHPMSKFLDKDTKQNLESLIQSMENGGPLKLTHENVININYHQCLFSERFIFSHHDEFSLIKDMLKNDKKYKHGPRMSVT